MRIPVCHCSRCHSPNTIRVHKERCEHWYCYDCGRSFDVPIAEDTGVSQGSTAPPPRSPQLIGSARQTSVRSA